MTAHTPGPWVVASGYEIHDRETRFDDTGARIGSTPNRIAIVDSVFNVEGDARLIAAAPELLAALDNALTAMELDAPNKRRIEIAAARAAIAKAKGAAS